MAQKVIRNDFVAGEIAPELWGRHDVEMYYHGAARIENFVPRRTGGLRKRAGTELAWHLAGNEAREYRIIPYLYDKDNFGLLALWRETGDEKVYALFRAFRKGGTTADSAADGSEMGYLRLGPDEHLDALRYLQIGDTLFFTYHGRRAFKCAVTYNTGAAAPELEWSQVMVTAKPAPAPSLKATPKNFKKASEPGYTASSRTYRLWGVKDGVLSEYSETTANITLAWISGAYIDVTFDPDWASHDYYILGKLQGGQFGEVTRFYPGRNNGKREDTAWTLDCVQSQTVGSTTYTAATADPSAAWDDTDTEDVNGSGLTLTGTWARKAVATYKSDAPILSVLLWTGAIMSDGTSVTKVGSGQKVAIKLRQGSADDGTVIASWELTPQYGESSHTLVVQEPKAPASVDPETGKATYAITIEDAATGAAAYIPLRGCILCSNTATLLFHGDNIQPGTLAGEQDALDVGDTGMDVDLLATWQQRLVAAASENLPFTLWFSTTGDLYNFYTYRPQNSDDAFEATMAATRATRILHVIAEKWLLLFTDSGEYTVGSTNGALAYNTIDIKKISGVGAHGGIPPVATESEVLFVAQDARSVYKLDYTLERDAVVPTNLSVRSEHVAALHGIVAIAYQRYPDSLLWCLLDDGTLASLTFFPDEQVCAWARHTLAGGSGLRAVDIFGTGSIRSDAETASTSDTFLVLRHDSKPGDVWVERLRPNVIVDRPSTSAAECADHMGYAAADRPAAGEDPKGAVAASMETLRMEPQQADTIGMANAQFGAVLRVLRSGLVAVRPLPEDGGRDADWRSNMPQSAHVPAESGGTVALARADIRIAPQVRWDREARFEIKSADKWPCDILALCVLGNFGNMRNGG